MLIIRVAQELGAVWSGLEVVIKTDCHHPNGGDKGVDFNLANAKNMLLSSILPSSFFSFPPACIRVCVFDIDYLYPK